MDDELAQPSTEQNVPKPSENDADDQSSGDEDTGLDWGALAALAGAAGSHSIPRPSIPKRGEKDFQPRQGGSSLQAHNLDRARNAMFDVLRSERSISSKNVSYGVWMPLLSRAKVTLAKGVHFTAMGHSALRLTEDAKLAKRLELLPEEALYLVERGTLSCTKELPDGTEAPMSSQQAFAEMIGCEGLTREKYQVFAYLKRLGYGVTRYRAPPDNPDYPLPRTPINISKPRPVFSVLWDYLRQLFRAARSIWSPLGLRWHHSYPSLFSSLRFIPAGLPPSKPQLTEDPYTIFYSIYKPNTPFKKTAPPPPDFHCVVVNANTTLLPTIQELSALFSELPESGPPLPRKRVVQGANGRPIIATSAPHRIPPLVKTRPLPWYYFFIPTYLRGKDMSGPPPPRIHPFAVLKAGKKNVVVAAVDNGNISFFRFSQGAFHEFPVV